jgi:hypothetical protein
MQGIIAAVDRLREEYDVLVLGAEDDAVTSEGGEVPGRGQRRGHAKR